MIFIGTLPDSITNIHWDYFIKSNGYLKLEELSLDQNIDQAERNYFSRLFNNETILRSIIIGDPEELKSEIEYFKTELINTMSLLQYYQDFISIGSLDEILDKINRNAEKKTSKAKVVELKIDYYNRFLSLERHINPDFREIIELPNNIYIKDIKQKYTFLNNTFNSTIKLFYDRIFSIFDYNNFIKVNNSWNAYRLTNALGVTVCPYCNRNYIHTSHNQHGKTRAELDHFFPKSKYPFLSISIYNLIPSCHVCNSNLKGAKDFYLHPHLHPYIDTENSSFKFEIKYKNDDIQEIITDLENFDIILNYSTKDEETKTKAENSCQTFHIEELYNYHKDIAQELLFKSVYYNETKIEELKNMLGEDSEIDEDFIKRVVIGGYTDINDLGKRSLSKYSLDIMSKTDLKRVLDL
ncbi:hypothetical protein [Myroides odoratus]|uniref:HNH endonuclease n=1 Tax=Myroides odoratus TaxID=256 RepID=UPI00333E817B